MWKKIMKYRETAKSFCKVEVHNGANTSFWFDNWMGEGSLMEKTGSRGVIDMGISRNMTVGEAWGHRRRRRHRTQLLNDIEEALAKTYQGRNMTRADTVLWRGKGDVFKASFSTKDTWNHIRTSSNQVAWQKGVWFTHANPKFSFCTWLALHDRLSTGDRMQRWNNGSTVSCVFCAAPIESRDHLFFSCPYSYEIWKALAQQIFNTHFTADWQQIVDYIVVTNHNRVHSYLARNIFQITIHTIWRERNARRHGEVPRLAATLIRWIDQHVRNQLSVIRSTGDRRYDQALQACPRIFSLSRSESPSLSIDLSELSSSLFVVSVRKMKHNNVIPSSHFRKHWQNYVKTWFNQPARKTRRRVARQKKAVKIFPRPTSGPLRPVVHGQTLKYNMKVRAGKGFTLEELKAAGIPKKLAPTIGISVDHRRKNRSLEGLQSNVQRLKTYKAKLVVFPRRSRKVKAGDSTPEELANATQVQGDYMSIASEKTAMELVKLTADLKAFKAYDKIRLERTNARHAGARAKRAAEAEKEEKK
ncbi:Ribosomal protein L13e [Arabidopsis thaliana x Arabidopsis arenosa]|uniref:60S ribosomal protein L13 n=1 Tax=Arabidopsis thaliana x Arabidopsis arenosa TaxID=1240361 RepID=A0A8T1Z0H2_9BRAS|nr:Ribosomal protein L13e [Arabidopsis thaliana x Arabidopsis arenosa]